MLQDQMSWCQPRKVDECVSEWKREREREREGTPNQFCGLSPRLSDSKTIFSKPAASNFVRNVDCQFSPVICMLSTPPGIDHDIWDQKYTCQDLNCGPLMCHRPITSLFVLFLFLFGHPNLKLATRRTMTATDVVGSSTDFGKPT